MTFKCVSRNDGSRNYIFDSEVNRCEFFSFIKASCDSLGATVELISIPEAEIAKINLPNGDIYAKYDSVYGLEIKSTALSDSQKIRVESVLSER